MSQTFLVITTFILGATFAVLIKKSKYDSLLNLSIWEYLYKFVGAYLLVVIGLEAGHKLAGESILEIWVPTLVGVAMSLFSAVFMYHFFKHTNFFDRMTGISVATHFGAVSIGTFFAGISLLDSLGIDYDHSAAIWLAAIELSAVVLGMVLLKAKASTIREVFLKDKALNLLPLALLVSYFLNKYFNVDPMALQIDKLFDPMVLVCLFLLGKVAGGYVTFLGRNSLKIIVFGIMVPIIVSWFASACGMILGYSQGDVFIFSLLAASCSTVIAPLSVKEILNSMYTGKTEEADRAISTSLAISIGVTLPFNILFGFELFFYEQKFFTAFPELKTLAIIFPFLILIIVYLLKQINKSFIDALDFEEIEMD